MKTCDSRALSVVPGSLPSSGNDCNKYDLKFLEWFARHGWQIHNYAGQISVWTNGDSACPFKVTSGMIERLEWNGRIERIFPQHAAALDYVWVLANNKDQT